jgi:hypothetical protein
MFCQIYQTSWFPYPNEFYQKILVSDTKPFFAVQQVENESINSCNLDNRCMADWSDFVSDSELVSAS